jgi:hypothetical protein
MSTGPSFQSSLQFEHRGRKRAEVEDFLAAHLGQKFSSYALHVRFGPGVRSRISEINSDPAAAITVHNETFFDESVGEEVSGYWAELRARHLDLG